MKHQLSERDEIGLSCRVNWVIEADRLPSAFAEMRLPNLLNLNVPAEQTYEFALTHTAGRIDFRGTSFYGTDISFIKFGNDSSLCISHNDKSFLSISSEAYMPVRFERPLTFEVEILTPGTDPNMSDDLNEVRISLRDIASGQQWRQRLWLERNQELQNYAVRFFELLFGNSDVLGSHGYRLDELRPVFEEYGFPVRGSLELADESVTDTTAIASFFVTEIRLAAFQVGQFEPPPDYLDAKIPENWETLRQRATDRSLIVLQPDIVMRPGTAGELPSGMAYRMRPVDGGREPREPIEPVNTRPATTLASAVALRIEQGLLTDLVRLLNDISAPIAGTERNPNRVTARYSHIRFDWLGELKRANTFSYCLLHEDTPQDPNKPEGRGYFDRMAAKEVPALFNVNRYPRSIISKLPQVIQDDINRWGDWWSSLPSDVRASFVQEYALARGITRADPAAIEQQAKDFFNNGLFVERIISKLSAEMQAVIAKGADIWMKLQADTRARLIREYVEEIYGQVDIPYPGQIAGFWPDEESALIGYEVRNLEGAIELPIAVPDPALVGVLVATFFGPTVCNSDGTISGSLDLGKLELTGRLKRWTTELYWVVTNGGSAVLSLLFPALTWVNSLLTTIGSFVLLDDAEVLITIAPLKATYSLLWEQSASLQPFELKVRTNLERSVSVRMLSVIPDGLHQLIDLVLSSIANASGVVIDQLEAGINRELEKMFAGLLGRGFPGRWLPPDIPVVSGQQSGASNEHVMIEVSLGTPSRSWLRITPQVANWNLRFEMERELERLKTTSSLRSLPYISLGANVNALNQIQAVLWDGGEYMYRLNGGELVWLQNLLKPPFPVSPLASARIYTASPPRLTLTGPSSTPMARHCRVEIDQVVLEMRPYTGQPSSSTDRFVMVFRVSTDGYFGFGQPVNLAGTLDLKAVRSQLFELLFDWKTAQVT
ncbi:MAG: hypothetical protein JNJ61_03100, partial [Anaerolineae bacterium]|nr:hypothetical protein [Anaerolineae bacterium]